MDTHDPGDPLAFAFDYDPGELRCGRGCVAALDSLLAERGLESALVVTGTTVGANRAVVDPVEAGLGDRLAGVFAETTPEKYLATGLAAARRVRETDADAIVAVGSGSSLDVAKVASALTSHPDPTAAAERAVPRAEHGESAGLAVAENRDPVPIVAVPTTLAGADLSVIAGVSLSLDPGDVPHHEVPNGGVDDRRLMPTALCYDLALFETTPSDLRCASAMNGFDKAVECLYSPHATPVTDGTAMRAVALAQSGFGALPDDEPDEQRLYESVAAVVLAQYGISTPGTYRASIIHAFAHGFSHDYDAHQGTVHGILAPHVLEYVFEHAHARRDLLAAAFGVEDAGASDDTLAAAVVDAVAGVRDDLGLPSRLRAVDGLSRTDVPAIARTVRADSLLPGAPDDVDPTTDDIEAVLDAAW